MRNVRTLVVAAGAAIALGGVGVGVAQAASPSPAATVTSSSQHGHEPEARGRVAEGETTAEHEAGTRHESEARHEAEARRRVAEGETHARHTGVDDPSRTGASAQPADDHGSDDGSSHPVKRTLPAPTDDQARSGGRPPAPDRPLRPGALSRP